MEHLVELTMSDDYIRVYELGIDVTEADLTDEERELLKESREYLKQKEIRQNAEQLRRARRDFEKLRDIPNMPEEAIKILQRWTYRHGDDEEDGVDG